MKWKWRGRELGNRGVALLQALIFVGLIAMTAATLLSLTLGGFIGASKTKTSGQDKFDAMSILPRVYADLEVCDPEADGAFNVGPPCNGFSNPNSTKSYDLDGRTVNVAISYAAGQYMLNITPQ